jgi:hypothetical protein
MNKQPPSTPAKTPDERKPKTPPAWLSEVTPDDEVMAAFYRAGVAPRPKPSPAPPPPESSSTGVIQPSLPTAPPAAHETTERNSTEQYGTARNSTEHVFPQEESHLSPQTPPNPLKIKPKTTKNHTSTAQYGTVRHSTAQYSTEHNDVPVRPEIPLAPTAPQRDFNRRPNSLERDAVPLGLFPGTTKVLYDVLFQRTRGAVEPTRHLQVTSMQLRQWARLSEKTLWRHLTYLERVGLLRRRTDLANDERFEKGGGNIYEVFVPEEIDLQAALETAETSKLTAPTAEASFPQRNSTVRNSTVRTKVPGTVRNNVPYSETATPLESTNPAPLRHVSRHVLEEESVMRARMCENLNQVFAEHLGRDLAVEERLALLATLSEELLDLIHLALKANADYGGRPIENPVAWFTAMIGQRLAGRNRKRTPEESLRAAVWMTLREIERRRGGRISTDERDEVQEELIRELAPRFEGRVENAARAIKEHITSWWMAIE